MACLLKRAVPIGVLVLAWLTSEGPDGNGGTTPNLSFASSLRTGGTSPIAVLAPRLQRYQLPPKVRPKKSPLIHSGLVLACATM